MESGKVYLLVITEYYTRFPFAFAVKNANAETTAKILYNNIFCLFGPPTEILTNRGSHFANAVIKDLCHLVNVRHKFSTPYHPQTNGLTENFNGTLVNFLHKVTIDHPTQWDKWINTALYVYRTKVHTTLKYSPYELLFGIIPKGIDLLKLVDQPLGQERLVLLDHKRDLAHRALIKKQVKHWNPSLKFKKGDVVLVKRGQRLKIQSKWYSTPYTIYRVHENDTYDLIDDNGEFFQS